MTAPLAFFVATLLFGNDGPSNSTTYEQLIAGFREDSDSPETKPKIAVESPPDFGANFSTQLLSGYLIGPGIVISDSWVSQSDLMLTFPENFYLDLWQSVGLNDTKISSDPSDEADYTFGKKGKFGDFSYDLSFAYFNLVRLGEGPEGDILRPMEELRYEFQIDDDHILTPRLRLIEFFPVELAGADSGIHATLGLGHDWKIGSVLSISHAVDFRYDTGALFFKPGLLGRYDIQANWQISETFSIQAPIFTISTPLFGAKDRDTETVIGTGINVKIF